MDDIVKVLDDRKRLLAGDQAPNGAENPAGEPATQIAEIPPLPPDSQSATGSGMVLVVALERPAEGEPARPPKPARAQIVEALLFAATAPLPENRLREVSGCTAEQLADSVAALNQQYEATGRAFRIHRIAQGYQLYTLPEYSEWVKGLFKTHRTIRLSRASLETLAIVAYKQPITKPEIEQFRGVDTTAPLMTLLERRLLALAGRAKKPGNPFLYRTSREFLRYFGLGSLDDLPRPEELESFLRRREEQAEAEDAALLGTAPVEIAEPKVPLEDSAAEPVSPTSEEVSLSADEPASEGSVADATVLAEPAGVPQDA